MSEIRHPIADIVVRPVSGIAVPVAYSQQQEDHTGPLTSDIRYRGSSGQPRTADRRSQPAQPRAACSRSDRTRWNAVKSESSVKMEKS